MVTWKDYLIAFILADLIWANIKVALFVPDTFLSILSVCFAYAVWQAWEVLYLPYRVRKENEKN